GIIWPAALAPFDIVIVPINMHKSEAVAQQCETLYEQLSQAGFDVLFMDEHKARLGVMLADVELLGIPHRLVVGDKGINEGCIEYQARKNRESEQIPLNDLLDFLKESIQL